MYFEALLKELRQKFANIWLILLKPNNLEVGTHIHTMLCA